MNATPRPLISMDGLHIKQVREFGDYQLLNKDRVMVADAIPTMANAALIVKACNAHDKLVDALKGCLQALRHAPIEGAFGKDARYKAEQVLREVGNDAL